MKYLVPQKSETMKKILIVSRSFYPENSPRSIRTTELVKEFARQGHEVTLITIKDDIFHRPFEEEHGVTIKDLGKLCLPKVELEGSNGLPRMIKRGLRRGLDLFLEYPDIELAYRVQRALEFEDGYDLLISIAVPYPVHWGVAKARTPDHRIAKTWVADCGDPYFGLENDSFSPPFYFSFVEKWFCRKTDFITIPFEGAQSAYFEEFHFKIRIVPQGLSFPKLSDVKMNYDNELVTFAYFGNIASYLHYAVPFLEKLNTVGKPFRFIVYTRRRDVFENTLQPKTLEKCSLRDYVDRDTLLRTLSTVDFLIHFPYQKESQKSLKLIDCHFLQKPILEYKNNEQSDQAFREFLDYDFTQKKEFEDYSKYQIENICTKFLTLTEDYKNRKPSVMTG